MILPTIIYALISASLVALVDEYRQVRAQKEQRPYPPAKFKEGEISMKIKTKIK